MKDYFLRLLGYDRHANLLLLTAIRNSNNPEKATLLMGHLLAAQQRWLKRCKGESNTDVVLFPTTENTPFEEVVSQNNQEWVAFISGLSDADFEHVINYATSDGAPFSNTLTEILTHLINHGTHHRAQIGQLLKQAGLETLPPTDYIFYIRQ